MRIAFLFPTIYASPKLFPDRIFAPAPLLTDLVDGLIDSGHEVTVYTMSDFKCKGRVVSIDEYTPLTPLPYEKFAGRIDGEKKRIVEEEFFKHRIEIELIQKCFADAKKGQFDLIHVYHDSSLFLAHYLEDLIDVPVVYTLHDPLPKGGSFEYSVMSQFPQHKYISISDSQRASDLKLNFIDTVYHGIRIGEFPFPARDLGYLLFMGRLTREKGLHTAIKVALETKNTLEIGTSFPNGFNGDGYFEKEIKPYLDNPLIREPGFAKGSKKLLLYKNAKALMFPIEWEEPFGMVMVEAMACGTPVIAYDRGSVSEIVKDGVTGFVIEDDIHRTQNSSASWRTRTQKRDYVIKKKGVEGMIEAVKRIGEIDRAACRRHVEEHFTVEKMVAGHEREYQMVISDS